MKGQTPDLPADFGDRLAKPPLALWEPSPEAPDGRLNATETETEGESGGSIDDDLSLRHPITGLVGSALLADRLRHTVTTSSRSKRTVLVALLELDRFGPVNDNFDDEVGDQILNVVASRLVENLRSMDTVAHVGPHEFALILERPGNGEVLCRRLVESIAAPMDIAGVSVWMSASLGAYIGHGDDPEEFLRFAAIALQRSKERGGDSCTVLGRA